MYGLRDHRAWCLGWNVIKFSNRSTALSTVTKDKRQQHQLLQQEQPQTTTTTTTTFTDRTTEPVAVVLPHTIADLRRPQFLTNARINVGSLEPSIVQEPDVRIVFDVTTTTTLPNTATTTDEAKAKRKKVELLPWQPSPVPITDVGSLLNKYLMLSKFRLTSLVVITSMGGYAMAPAAFDVSTFALCAVGTGLCSAAANAINQYHEVPFDAQMSRTKNRVLVKGLVTPLHAIGFATASATIGLTALYWGCNGLTCALGAGNLVLYTMVYTPMKRYSILNTWVGSVVGAIPPVMGWVGCSGTMDTGAWVLAGLLYAWQFPHFNALSWNLRPDYSRAGYRMMAVTDPALCRRVALRYCVAIGALSLAAPLLDVTNVWFALETLPLNGWFGWLAWRFYRDSDSNSSRRLFRFSLLHLPVLMVLFLLNKKKWMFAEATTTSADTTIAATTTTALAPVVSIPATSATAVLA